MNHDWCPGLQFLKTSAFKKQINRQKSQGIIHPQLKKDLMGTLNKRVALLVKEMLFD
jgi:hypothetical protein